jgi:hypothetical protein
MRSKLTRMQLTPVTVLSDFTVLASALYFAEHTRCEKSDTYA